MHYAFVLRLSVLSSLAASVAVAAQEPDTVVLNPVVVTATRVPTPADAVTAAVTIVSGRELQLRGIRTVAEALRAVPGAAVVETGSYGGQTSLFLRGGESDYVKVLVDGVPQNQPGGAFDFADLTTDNVDRIEIVRGPASVLYGSDAVTGVIQIFTRTGSGAPRVTAAARAGTYGAAEYQTGLAGGRARATRRRRGHGRDRLRARAPNRAERILRVVRDLPRLAQRAALEHGVLRADAVHASESAQPDARRACGRQPAVRPARHVPRGRLLPDRRDHARSRDGGDRVQGADVLRELCARLRARKPEPRSRALHELGGRPRARLGGRAGARRTHLLRSAIPRLDRVHVHPRAARHRQLLQCRGSIGPRDRGERRGSARSRRSRHAGLHLSPHEGRQPRPRLDPGRPLLRRSIAAAAPCAHPPAANRRGAGPARPRGARRTVARPA